MDRNAWNVINPSGEPVYDMCAYCSLDTAGQHELDCPSAGKGDIADEIRVIYPDGRLTLIEISGTLVLIRQMRG